MDIIKRHKKQEEKNSITDKATNIISMQNNQTDPNGSYTGVPQNPCDKPVQDVDDL